MIDERIRQWGKSSDSLICVHCIHLTFHIKDHQGTSSRDACAERSLLFKR
jgi:hypothetical protein